MSSSVDILGRPPMRKQTAGKELDEITPWAEFVASLERTISANYYPPSVVARSKTINGAKISQRKQRAFRNRIQKIERTRP